MQGHLNKQQIKSKQYEPNRTISTASSASSVNESPSKRKDCQKEKNKKSNFYACEHKQNGAKEKKDINRIRQLAFIDSTSNVPRMVQIIEHNKQLEMNMQVHGWKNQNQKNKVRKSRSPFQKIITTQYVQVMY